MYCGMAWYSRVWYGVVAHSMVWYGMVWYGMVWYGMVWYGMVWYGMVWYGMVWYGMVWYGMVWYGMVSLAGHGCTQPGRNAAGLLLGRSISGCGRIACSGLMVTSLLEIIYRLDTS